MKLNCGRFFFLKNKMNTQTKASIGWKKYSKNMVNPEVKLKKSKRGYILNKKDSKSDEECHIVY